ncbi:response regulator transcription factor [Virgisporangium ochraceum]|uniref:Transcriptional regulator n=1 Tax=Virgisporangium ochraceum TaxID=65505 RepID=A0A8J4EF16_9ACTN|nr:response regulator transcription factor [Virgisporangium ochraceum]GIJ73195.1 transcriptional regulator [Virgisporangium ochraceum]
MRLLLVEDDHELSDLLAAALSDEGYTVEVASDGQRGLHLGLTRRYDVVVIDRRIPAIDGLDLLRRLRGREVRARAMMLTALGSVHERIQGLDAGADDYMVKPFDLNELLARLRALCRHTSETGETLPIGAAHLDLNLRDVALSDGRRVALSAREFDLLRVLAARPMSVHTRSELCRTIFQREHTESTVDTYVYYLRRKLGRDAVRTVYGIGYRLGTLS